MLAAGAFAARLRVERRAAETAVRPALWQSEAQAISRTLRASEVVTGSGRISARATRELLIDIKQRGLEIAPDLAVADGALGFWKAIEEARTSHQLCWVHKTANVLNKVALSVQANMKAATPGSSSLKMPSTPQKSGRVPPSSGSSAST